ncbi:MAG: hypothetical protein R8M45_11920, partial [Ghiorsea sp.]
SCGRFRRLNSRGNGQSVAVSASGLFLCLIASFSRVFLSMGQQLAGRVRGGFTPAGFAFATSVSTLHSACLSTFDTVFGGYTHSKGRASCTNPAKKPSEPSTPNASPFPNAANSWLNALKPSATTPTTPCGPPISYAAHSTPPNYAFYHTNKSQKQNNDLLISSSKPRGYGHSSG